MLWAAYTSSVGDVEASWGGQRLNYYWCLWRCGRQLAVAATMGCYINLNFKDKCRTTLMRLSTRRNMPMTSMSTDMSCFLRLSTTICVRPRWAVACSPRRSGATSESSNRVAGYTIASMTPSHSSSFSDGLKAPMRTLATALSITLATKSTKGSWSTLTTALSSEADGGYLENCSNSCARC